MQSFYALITLLGETGQRPDQGLPPFQGRPDNTLPGWERPTDPGYGQGTPRPDRPDNSLPGYGRPDNTLPGGRPIIIPPNAIGPGVPSQAIVINPPGHADNTLPGQGGVDPGYGQGTPRPDRPEQGLPGSGARPDNTLPGRPTRPEQGLPPGQGRPDNTLPGQGGRPSNPIVYPPGIDNTLPPTPGLPPIHASPPIIGLPGPGQIPDNTLPGEPPGRPARPDNTLPGQGGGSGGGGSGGGSGLPEGSVLLIPVSTDRPVAAPPNVPPGSMPVLAWGGRGTLPVVCWIPPKAQPK